jgi:Ion transport protein
MGFYTFEMTIKIMGLGFILNKGSYLRDPWNDLDFVIVSSGLITLFFSGSKLNLGGLRSFRVLRPLKTITNIEGLKKLVVALLSSVS